MILEVSTDTAARLYALLGEVEGDDAGLAELYAQLAMLLRPDECYAYEVDVSTTTEAPIVIRRAEQ